MALSSAKSLSRKTVQRALLRNKDLDFLILTGCSCLITLLHHPMMNHLQGSPGGQSSAKPTPAEGHSNSSHSSRGSRTAPNGLGSYSAVTPKRQNFRIEEDEA